MKNSWPGPNEHLDNGPPGPRLRRPCGEPQLTPKRSDKSALARAEDPIVGGQLAELAGDLFVCPVGELEQLYSARSSRDYDALKESIRVTFVTVPAPSDILDRALALQQD